MPVEGQPWDTDPFEATLRGDRLYGRGVTDMKSFSAVGLAFVPEFVRRGLRKPLHFARFGPVHPNCGDADLLRSWRAHTLDESVFELSFRSSTAARNRRSAERNTTSQGGSSWRSIDLLPTPHGVSWPYSASWIGFSTSLDP